MIVLVSISGYGLILSVWESVRQILSTPNKHTLAKEIPNVPGHQSAERLIILFFSSSSFSLELRRII